MSEIKGYVAGSGATFTPSKKATWTEEFNDLLVTTGMSRNALTDQLIEVGLAHKNQQKPSEKLEADTLFNNAYFSPMERELLKTSTYQQIIREFAKSLLTNSRAAMETTFQQASSPNYNPTYPAPVRMEYMPVQKHPIEAPLVNGSPTQAIAPVVSEETAHVEVKPKHKGQPVKEDVSQNVKDKSVGVATDPKEVKMIDGLEVADLSKEMDFLSGLGFKNSD